MFLCSVQVAVCLAAFLAASIFRFFKTGIDPQESCTRVQEQSACLGNLLGMLFTILCVRGFQRSMLAPLSMYSNFEKIPVSTSL